MTLRNKIIVNNLAEMENLARQVATEVQGGQVLLLTGEIGAGKTTFTQYLARALGVKSPITSPTFTLAAEYPVTKHPIIKRLIHVDLYRLPETMDRPDPLVAEILAQSSKPDVLTVVEWAERWRGDLPTSVRSLFFETSEQPKQRVVII